MSAVVSEQKRGGFSLVEVVIAVGVAATGLLVVFSLMPGLFRQNSEAKDTLVALGLSDSITIEVRRLAGINPSNLAAQAADFEATQSQFRLVAARDGTDLREQISDARPEYFLIELHRFPANSVLAPAGGDSHLHLQARISWPYRPTGVGEETPNESRQRVQFNILIQR